MSEPTPTLDELLETLQSAASGITTISYPERLEWLASHIADLRADSELLDILTESGIRMNDVSLRDVRAQFRQSGEMQDVAARSSSEVR